MEVVQTVHRRYGCSAGAVELLYYYYYYYYGHLYSASSQGPQMRYVGSDGSMVT